MNDHSSPATDAIRSDIDQTRRRMDDTMDAIGNRLQGRHLVDEILGFFRRSDSDGVDGDGTPAKLKRSADAAMHAVVDTVKANPIPALMIGAGIAWLIYSSQKDKSPAAGADDDFDPDTEFADYDPSFDPSAHIDRPLEYPSASGESAGGKVKEASQRVGEKLGHAKDALVEKASSATDHVKETLGQVGERAREKFQNARYRAGELGARAKERTREVYVKSRDRVVSTAHEHPLEVGLGCLAAGVLAGLALPTPEKVNRVAGPSMDRLRDRTRQAGRDVVAKGRRVAQAATQAVKDEAQAQGLTFDRVREQAGAIADRARDAATDKARQEGIAPGSLLGGEDRPQPAGSSSGSPQENPSSARPVV